MKELVLPAKAVNYITSAKPESSFANKPFFFVGKKDLHTTYRSLLYFDTSTLSDDFFIANAVLCVYCLSSCNENSIESNISPYPIMSSWNSSYVCWNNQPEINTQIKSSCQKIYSAGWHDFDVTDIANHWVYKTIINKGIMLKSQEHMPGDAKKFISSNLCYDYIPKIKIKCYNKDCHYLCGRKSVSLFDKYSTEDFFNFSKWINTSSLTKSTFFVSNLGQNPAIVIVQVSPDKNSIVTENQQIVVNGQETKIIEPMHFSFFARIAFKSLIPGKPAFLNIWFQGHV